MDNKVSLIFNLTIDKWNFTNQLCHLNSQNGFSAFDLKQTKPLRKALIKRERLSQKNTWLDFRGTSKRRTEALKDYTRASFNPGVSTLVLKVHFPSEAVTHFDGCNLRRSHFSSSMSHLKKVTIIKLTETSLMTHVADKCNLRRVQPSKWHS